MTSYRSSRPQSRLIPDYYSPSTYSRRPPQTPPSPSSTASSRTPTFNLTVETVDRSRSRSDRSRVEALTSFHRSSSVELAAPRSSRSSRVSALISRISDTSPLTATRPQDKPPRLGDSSALASSWQSERSPRREATLSRRHSWRKDVDGLDDELEKIKSRTKVDIEKTENKLKLEAFNDASKRRLSGEFKLEIAPRIMTPTSPVVKPTFESKYRSLETKIDEKRFRKEQEKINDMTPKKGTWRKEFAKFEDDLEFDKIRKDNRKKIALLECEGSSRESKVESVASRISRFSQPDPRKEVKVKTRDEDRDRGGQQETTAILPSNKSPRLEVLEPITRVTARSSQPAELSQTETCERKRSSPVISEVKEAMVKSSLVGLDCTESVGVKETKVAKNSQISLQNSPQVTPPKWMKTTDPNNKEDCDAEPKQSKDCGQQLNTFEATLKSEAGNEVKPAKPKWKRPEEVKDQTGQVLNGPHLNSSQNKKLELSQETPKILQKQPNKSSKVQTKTVSNPENKGVCVADPEQSKDSGLKENRKPQLKTFDATLKSDVGNEVKPAKPKWKRPDGVNEPTGHVLSRPKLNSSQNKKLDIEISQETPIVLEKQPTQFSKVSTKTVSKKPTEIEVKGKIKTSGILDTKPKGTVSNLNGNQAECTKKVSEPETKISDKLESNSIKPTEKLSNSTTKSKKTSTKTEDITMSSLPDKCDKVTSKQTLKKSPKECQDKMPMQQLPSTNPPEESGKKINSKFEARECPKMKEVTKKNETKSQNSPEEQSYIHKTSPEETQPDPITLNIENNPLTEELKDTKVEEEEEVEEDASGMRAMRKEMDTRMESMEAEFASGASKLAALRARMKRLREASRANKDE